MEQPGAHEGRFSTPGGADDCQKSCARESLDEFVALLIAPEEQRSLAVGIRSQPGKRIAALRSAHRYSPDNLVTKETERIGRDRYQLRE